MSLRKKVLWIGPEPNQDVKQRLDELDLVLTYLGYERTLTNNDFADASSLVFNVPDGKAGVLLSRLESLAIPALDHGLEVVVKCSSDEVNPIHAQLAIDELDGQIRLVTESKKNPYQLPKLLFSHSNYAGPAYRETCDICLPEGLVLAAEQVVFLKRAFWDCKQIHLEPLTSGVSATAYCIRAINLNEAEGRPMPFFAKFDVLSKIVSEHENYNDNVLPFIPFNLRPNLDDRRCIHGARHGLLVGNFVEHSESLWEVINRGDARAAIYSLFDNVLRSWRHDLNIVPSRKNLFKIDISEEKYERLLTRSVQARQFGVALEPEKLIETLKSLPPITHITTRIHGDLHAENVRVRNNDAILIDFASVDWGPSSRDSADLEVWIAFSKWPKNVSFRNWKKLIEELYDSSKFYIQLPKLKHEPDIGCSIWNYVRQIRGLVFPDQLDRHEYQLSLSYGLFRHATRKAKGRNKREISADEKRRAYAYFLAGKLAKMPIL